MKLTVISAKFSTATNGGDIDLKEFCNSMSQSVGNVDIRSADWNAQLYSTRQALIKKWKMEGKEVDNAQHILDTVKNASERHGRILKVIISSSDGSLVGTISRDGLQVRGQVADDAKLITDLLAFLDIHQPGTERSVVTVNVADGLKFD